LKRHYVFGLVLSLAAAACGARRKPSAEAAAKAPELSEALRPAFMAKALHRLGGVHFHGTTRLAVEPSAVPADVTTTTDVFLDRGGNYRLHEENDRDGGRDVVLYGRELAVALRYGRMIRRVAEEPEPSRLLEQALGGPSTVYDLVGERARVTRAGSELYGGAKATVFELALGDGGGAPARPARADEAGDAAAGGLAAWRSSATLEAASGRAAIDDATGALVKADLTARFSTTSGGKAVKGTIEVHTSLSDMASTPTIARPPAEDLALRQRTVPEQHELLRGLAEARPPAEPARRKAGSK
jgi:hypothetical protein